MMWYILSNCCILSLQINRQLSWSCCRNQSSQGWLHCLSFTDLVPVVHRVSELTGALLKSLPKSLSFRAVVPNLFSVVDPFDDLAESCGPPYQNQLKPCSGLVA